ncbi:MAG: glycyl-radical enzyme activating protein [Lachnospiraceae bacterium]|nr:glycyl-radical enzyme activating protein [Lachnospiraceae bacterium]
MEILEPVSDVTKKGLVFNIQRFSVNDGPGVRTIVFLNGCPLRCKWCCNPESQELKPIVMFKRQNCVGCGNCEVVCPTGAASLMIPERIDHSKCITCGKCVDVCYHRALEMSGKWMTVEDVMKELYSDRVVYRRTGGGITISGGEALMQHEFLSELLKTVHSLGWTTAIETTGYASREVLEEIIPQIDYTMMDIKHVDPAVHKKWTGVDNKMILENALIISELSKHYVVRVPIIPGFNDDPRVVGGIAKFATFLPKCDAVHLLPYHDMGSNKYGMMGRNYELDGVKSPKEEFMKKLKEEVEKEGLSCKIGG